MDSTIRNFFAEVGSRLPDTLAVMIAYWLPVFAFVWYSGLVDDIYARLWISALVTVMPVAALFSKPKYGLRIWRWPGEDLGIALFLWLATLLAAVNRFGIVGLELQLSLIIVVLPWCWFIWLMLRRNRLLLTGLVSAFAAFMIYWVAALVKFGAPWELGLLPLVMVTFGGLAWAPLAGPGSEYGQTTQAPQSQRSGNAGGRNDHPVSPRDPGCGGNSGGLWEVLSTRRALPQDHGGI